MKKAFASLTLFVVAVVAIVPLIDVLFGNPIPQLSPVVVRVLNFVAWSIVAAFLLWRLETRKALLSLAQDLGIDTSRLSLERMLGRVLSEVERKNRSLSMNVLERRISSEKELSDTLETVVELARQLLNAQSAELALYDPDTQLYHSSFVVGKPFRTSAQAMLSGALEGRIDKPSPDVMVEPIAFAGSILGSLRVALRVGEVPSQSDRQIMRLLSLQSGLAIVNTRYTQQLIRLKAASEESIKAKTGFLANLSHELRGPIGIMLNAVELVLDGLCGSVTEEQAEILSMIRSNGEHLLELINDVLDYAKIESGKVAPQRSDILLHDVLKDLCGVVRQQAEAKSHRLNYIPNEEALAISCDRRHFRQMMINLLTNAIKYTPDGGTIEVWAERVPGQKVRVNVKDSGVGIEASERSKVFSAFERVENSYSLVQEGSGLGMSLTKRLVEVNGGQINFDSVPQQGSRFWLIFPTIQATSDMTRSEPGEGVQAVEAEGKGNVVLLVQRADSERQMVARYLTHIGFRIMTASNKVEAFDAIQRSSVELIILDNNIVDSLDEDVVQEIRASVSKNVPVVLVTTRAFIFDIERYLKGGIDRCLIKPLKLQELGITSRQLIDGNYVGEVIDSAELELTKHQEILNTTASKLLGVDDILH